MYMDKNRQPCRQRANNDFLRRMTGGELGAACPICRMGQARGERPPMEEMPMPPSCVGNDRPYPEQVCPHDPRMPSPAMVYSPVQCFRELYTPEEALMRGTLFKELDLPFAPNGNFDCGGICKQ